MTLTLLLVIVGVFGVQVIMGVSPDNPKADDLLAFGANFLPLTIYQPWRLLLAGFSHHGIMHLLFNGFALYYFGQVGEMMVGKVKFLLLFLLAIIGGNLLSAYHAFYQFLQTKAGIPLSVGASGGIMGIGAMLLILSFSHHPFAKHLSKKNLFLVMGVNLIMGFALPNIDNAGHIGGALIGLTLGLIFGFLAKFSWIGIGAVLSLLVMAFWYLTLQVAPYL